MRKLISVLCILCFFSCSKSNSGAPYDDDTSPYISITSKEYGTAKVSGEYKGFSESGVAILWGKEEGYFIYGGERQVPPGDNPTYVNRWFFTITPSLTLEAITYRPANVVSIDSYNDNHSIYGVAKLKIKINSIVNNRCSGTIAGLFIKKEGMNDNATYSYSDFTGVFKNLEIVALY